MIRSIYPTNILVKQLTISDEELSSIFVYLKAQHLSFLLDDSNDLIEHNSGNENILYDAIERGQCLEMAPLIKEVKDAFINLAYSNINNYTETNPNNTNLDVEIQSCRVNIVKPNNRMPIHSHFGDDAHACLYFEDLEEKEGGQLVMYDPRWQRNYWFGGSKLEKITPKKGLLVVAPDYIWHEVSEYKGNKDRYTLVFNARVFNNNLRRNNGSNN